MEMSESHFWRWKRHYSWWVVTIYFIMRMGGSIYAQMEQRVKIFATVMFICNRSTLSILIQPNIFILDVCERI